MKNKQENEILYRLYLTCDEIETLLTALQESKLPKSKDDGWNEENEKVLQKVAKMRWEQVCKRIDRELPT